MKKFFYSVLAAATMLFATTSCSQDEEIVGGGTTDIGTSQKVTFTVQLPSDGVESRTISKGVEVGQGNMVDKLVYALYEVDADGKVIGLQTPLATGVGEKVTDKEFVAKIDMVKGLSYKVLFLAYNEDAPAFVVEDNDDLLTLDLNTSLSSNQESYDAFVACHPHTVNADAMTTVYLKRPFAQINAATTIEDLDKAESLRAVVTKSQLTIKNVPTQYNVFSGEVTNNKDLTYATAPILKTIYAKADEHPNDSLEVSGKFYYYLNMAYVLAGETEDGKGSTHNATFEFFRETQPELVNTINITNLPIERNYRTNVLGNLLTQTENFQIIVDADFISDKNIWVDGVEAPEFDENTQTYYITNPAEFAWISAASNGHLRPAARTATESDYNDFAGTTIELQADLDLSEYDWTPIGLLGNSYENAFKGTFKGNGHTISNVNIKSIECAGLFGKMTKGTIQDLKVKNVNIEGHHYAGAIVAWLEQGAGAALIKNCYVENGTITLTPEMIDGTYDNGDKAGGIVGFLYGGTVEECSAKNLNITAYRDLGGIAGYAKQATIKNNTLSGNTVVVDQTATPYAGAPKDAYAGAVLGRDGGQNTVEPNNVEDGEVYNGIVTVSTIEELQKAIDEATASVIIKFGADINTGVATLIQKAGIDFVIDGCEHIFGGTFKVHAKSNRNNNGLVTFKDINFETSASKHEFIQALEFTNNERYSQNITIEGCTFTAVESTSAVHTAVGVKVNATQNLNIRNCTATNMHSFLQAQSCDDIINIDNVNIVNGKNGIAFGNTKSPTITNSTINSTAYGIRGDGTDARECNLVVSNTIINSNIPVIVRELKDSSKKYSVNLDENVALKSGQIYDVVFTVGTDDLEKLSSPSVNCWSISGADNYNVYPRETTATSMNATSNTQLSQVVAAGATTINLAEGTYSIPSEAAGKTLTISGTEETVIKTGNGNGSYVGLGEGSIKFDGVTIQGQSSGQYNGFAHAGNMTYNNCTIDGTVTIYSSSTFTNCTFNLPKGCYVWTAWGAAEVTYEKCTFNTAGKALLVYHENGTSTVNVRNCVFNATAGDKAGDIANQNCAAIEIANYGKGVGTNSACNFTVNTSGNTYSDYFSGEWRIKGIDTTGSITVNGENYTNIALDGKKMTIDANKNVTVEK